MTDVPTSWALISLADVVETDAPIIYGILQPGPHIAEGVPYVRPTEIQDGRVLIEDLRRTSPAIAERYRRAALLEGDVLLSIVGTIGKVAVVPGELAGGNITQSSCRLRPAEGLVIPALLAAFLRSPAATEQFREMSLGTAVPRLNLEDVRKIEMSLPPLAEQRRIVAKLDVLTARTVRARADLNRVLALAERARRAVLNTLFARGWPETEIGEITTDVRYGTAAKCEYLPKLTPVLRIPNVANGQIDTSDMKYATFQPKEIAKLALRTGDLLVIRSNGSLGLVGKAAVVTSDAAGMLFAGYLIRLRLDTAQAEPEFVNRVLQAGQTRAAIEASAKSSSGVNNINSEELRRLVVPLPSLEEQRQACREIATTLAEIDRLVADATAAHRLLGRLDQAILAKAFRGELVLQDPADEPASVLLERVRSQRGAMPATGRRGRRAVNA
jgi:type I restriction enzyme S subunit